MSITEVNQTLLPEVLNTLGDPGYIFLMQESINVLKVVITVTSALFIFLLRLSCGLKGNSLLL